MLRKTFVHRGPLHSLSDGVTFSLYSADEIRELSVVKCITPLAFNALGHPLPGGLYDPLMGPHDQQGMCGTCQQSIMFCSGHLGHIQLPLPVINPLFIKTLLQIFRISCLVCKSITIPPLIKHQSVAQLKLLKMGLFKEAQDAEAVMAGLISNDEGPQKGRNTFNEDETMVMARFDAYVQEFIDSALESGRVSANNESTRNVENLRMSVLRKVAKLSKMSQKCPHCGAVCKNMRLFESKIVYTLMSAGHAPRRRNSKFLSSKIDRDDTMPMEEYFEDSAYTATQKYWTPIEARDHLRKLWENHSEFLGEHFPVLQTTKLMWPTDLLFVDVLPVTPPKNRPAQMVNNMHVEHPQNLALKHVVSSCLIMTYVLQAIKNEEIRSEGIVDVEKGGKVLSVEALRTLKGIRGSSLNDKLETVWNDLQVDVDHVMDRDKGQLSASAAGQLLGLKQIIEKKEGLFRMHMMGKRVNFAARTVITPDPNIHIEEIGIPDIFAKILTFPTPVTFWNVNHLRKMVLNGPNIHPGAMAVENELGQICRLDGNNYSQRQGIAKRLLVSDKLSKSTYKGVKIVHRHLQNGDMLLLNRQPSLHRPSIMAHRARVLHGEKVFRLHYANCKHYNADFDGDEMNAHFPQSTLARSEAANLLNVCSHFLVPKDGTPLGGLIQDHVVAAVKLTTRGRFFTRADYQQLVFFALSDYSKPFKTEPPTILKPVHLWSGKQVISTIIMNLVPNGRIPPTFSSSAKIKSDEWRQCPVRYCKAGGQLETNELSESTVIFRKGQLLSGILDKVHLGATPYGLCHTFFELYGDSAVGALLSAFSRLMTNFLQWEGFTLGVKDVLVKRPADVLRRSFMIQSTKIGHEAASLGVGSTPDIDPALLTEKLEKVHRSGDPKLRAIVDQSYKQVLDGCTNSINRSCLPHGLVSIFPQNNLQLLVQSGAKGSTVNTMQMSCLLGQIELEGKRPPWMISGKSLPSFKPYDTSARAGGFISGRFLTGIRPQEFFFHCMAGREGLIDTAVKTSRSGYLQRCLVKLLEGVATQYDGTVRDSDGSVIQFLYGEDGLDVCKSQYLKPKLMDFLSDNAEGVLLPEFVNKIRTLGPQEEIAKSKQELKDWLSCNNFKTKSKRESGFLSFLSDISDNYKDTYEFNSATGRSVKTETIIQKWYEVEEETKLRYNKLYNRCPDPLVSIFRPDANYGAVSETLDAMLEKYFKANGWNAELKDLIYYKAMRAQSAPGDAVGVLAAQSIGEPSTQMTLNTFHFAGRGEMNVTLGIPRLREILMVASAKIKTPSMDIPFLPTVTEDEAEDLRLRLTRVTLSQVLQEVHVTEKIDVISRDRICILKFIFLSEDEYEDKFWIKPNHILRYFENIFLKHRLIPAMKRAAKMKREASVGTGKGRGRGRYANAGDDDGDMIQDDFPDGGNKRNYFEESEKKGGGEGHLSSDEDPEGEDEDATQQTRRARQTEAEYDAPEEEERLEEDPGEGGEIEMEEQQVVEIEQNEFDEIENDIIEYRISLQSYEDRVSTVSGLDDFITDYDFDRFKEEHCTVTLQIPLSSEKMNIGAILKEQGGLGVIHQVKDINRAFVATLGEKLSLKTEGINILAMAHYPHLLDLNKLHCNNIHTMAEHYGIEASSKIIVKEMTDVFKAYGITLDHRHLTLIGDYMTFSGTYRPFNRLGIESSSSPLQQMSFETVVSFLKNAILSGRCDELTNPSARLVLGKPPLIGTGIFELRQKLSKI